MDAWTRLTVRDGEKGPVEIELVKRRVQTRLERKRTGPQEWLVVTRCPLADENGWDAQTSRDASDQDTCYRYRYYLTPTQTPETELEGPSLAELARVIKAGVCIEASFKRGKSEAGMDAYQVRTVRRESTIEECGTPSDIQVSDEPLERSSPGHLGG
jgi:hypothetical protein